MNELIEEAFTKGVEGGKCVSGLVMGGLVLICQIIDYLLDDKQLEVHNRRYCLLLSLKVSCL
jgi:hypothetical protein